MKVLDYQFEYPEDGEEYSGLYGYHMTYASSDFLGNSNRYYLFMSEFKAQSRLFCADLSNPGEVKFIDFLNKSESREGDYTLLAL